MCKTLLTHCLTGISILIFFMVLMHTIFFHGQKQTILLRNNLAPLLAEFDRTVQSQAIDELFINSSTNISLHSDC